MKHTVPTTGALWVVSAALLLAVNPSSVSGQSLLSLDLGGGETSGVVTSKPASSTSTIPTTALTAPSGNVSIVSTTSATSSSATSPAYAAGTVTYIPDPLPTSTSSIDVTSLPSSVPAINQTASSNFTLPSATATGTFQALPTLQSTPYQIVFADTSGLPGYHWNLALNSSSMQSKDALCASQMQFCQTAGCDTADAKLTNFCETQYMGVGCYCSKGKSRLEQYQWPVMLADCQGRNTACRDACIKPNQNVTDQNACLQDCSKNYGSTCGTPGQYAANYAVRNKGDKPTYTVVQGGTAGNSGVRENAGKLAVGIIATLAVALLVGV